MRNKTFTSSMVLSVACVSAANAAVAFDSFTVGQTTPDSAVAWASPSSSQPIFGASGMRSAFAYSNNYSPASASVAAGTATFTTAAGVAGLSYSGNAQDLTGYTFSFDLNMTGAGGNTFFMFQFESANSNLDLIYVNYRTPGSYTVDLSTRTFNYTAITNITIALSTSDGSATMSNFTYTPVPAPGALALLGAAGLVGARRRKA